MLLDQKILNRIEEKKKNLDSFRPLQKDILRKLREQFIIEWTYNSNAIEGNTLTLKETALVLREGITVKGKTLREHIETTNHKKAIELLEKFVLKKAMFSEKQLLALHGIILSDIEDEFAGRYRIHRVRILGANIVLPNPISVPKLMSEYFEWLNTSKNNMSVIEFSALAHYKLVAIHPFVDGNGRTARLFMNLILMQMGYPPAIILKQDRKKYYDVLNKANKGDLAPFVLFVAQAIDRSLGLYLEAVEHVDPKTAYMKNEYITLSELSKMVPYSQEYLSLLARKGILHAIKKERNWLSTKEAVEKYIDQKSKKR
ncbi:Fic family protein [Patescibacteria group bacterium]|nr:Fic family protein [Patescibacteria group bacterium]MBU1721230.1 Fic family protein [Patescibacteria group bacterium]MBU1901062.1 Fic family protein [Patescibacteria group bacterium]